MKFNQILPQSKLLNRNQSFIGRKEYLKQIESSFSKENKKQIVILSSFAGTGKSSIANVIGHRFNEKFRNQFVYWMRSDEKNNLDAEIREFALDLKVITSDEKLKKPTNYVVEKIASKILRNHLNEEFLFILDNCDTIENSKEFLNLIADNTALTNVKFIITTRNGSPLENINESLEAITKHVVIEPFDKSESIEFIKLNLNNLASNETEINELLNLFVSDNEYRPIVLNKFIAFIKLRIESSGTNALGSLIEEMKSNKIQIDTIDNNLYENIIKKKQKAWEFLKYCSFLDPEFSPINLYTDLFDFNFDDMTEIVDVLNYLSIITIEDKDDEYGIRIHRTLHKETKAYLELKNEDEANKTLMKIIIKIDRILKHPTEPMKWNK